jgi:hypothetical protein
MNFKLKKGTVRTATGICIGLFTCCSLSVAQDVKYNYMPGTNFSKYHTYKWAEVQGGAHPSQILNQEIKQDIDNALAQKGFTPATSGEPDLYVVYQIAVDQEKQWNAWGMRGFGGMGQATSSTIAIGTLVLDFYDAASKTQIWRGDATKTLDPSGNQQKNMKTCRRPSISC